MEKASTISLIINETKYHINPDLALTTLAQYLREHLQLTSPKIVCAEGDCGACNVILEIDENNHFEVVNSCIIPLAIIDQKKIFTLEYLQQIKEINPLINILAKQNASQCGFCSPGMCLNLAATSLGDKNKSGENRIRGNLCRCTGYVSLRDSINEYENILNESDHAFNLLNYCKNISPKNSTNKMLEISQEDFSYFAPTDLLTALKFKKEHPHLKIIAGATDLGVLQNKQKIKLDKLMSLSKIPQSDLNQIIDDYLSENFSQSRFCSIHANEKLEESAVKIIQDFPLYQEVMDNFASLQIRNQATLIGNICNASPIGDTLPFLQVVNASILLAHVSDDGLMKINHVPLRDFFLAYKKLKIRPEQIAIGIIIPIPDPAINKSKNIIEFSKWYKVSTRDDLDISTVSLCISLKGKWINQEETNHFLIDVLCFSTGGMNPTVSFFDFKKLLPLNHKATKFNQELINKLKSLLLQFVSPISDVRSDSSSRLKLFLNLFDHFYFDFNLSSRINHEA